MRLFTAIDLPADTLHKLDQYLARLRPLARLHWSSVENLHITTKFIGEWPEPRLKEIQSALDNISQPQPFDVAIHGIGWFPDARRPRVFWAGVDAAGSLRNLARSTEQAVAAIGVPVEPRAYSPHLTLARVREPINVDPLAFAAGHPDFGAFRASSFFLYLSQHGKYSKLAEFPFHP